MKKVWLVLLAVVLVFGLAMFGCKSGSSDDDDELLTGGDLEEKVVFDMAKDEGIQALALGEIANTAFAGDANPIKPLVRAGENAHIKIEVVDNDGKKAIKFTTIADWGAGIDLRYAAFGLRAGDNIKIVGEFVSGSGRVQVNGQVGDENATIGGVDTRQTEIGPFDIEFTLQEKDVIALKKGDPAGLRIEGRKDGIVAQINNITIKGLRPSNLATLTAPVIEATEKGVKWEAVEGAGGYKVFADAGETPITTGGPSDTSANLADLKSLADGTYSITVVAVGIAGASKDSPASNAVPYTKVTPPPSSIKIKVAGTAQDAVIGKTKGTYTILEDQSGYTFTYPTEGSNINYGNSYVYYKVNLGANALSSFTSIKFTIEGKAGAISYKQINIAAFVAEPTGNISGGDSSVIARHSDYAYPGTKETYTYAYGKDAKDNSALTSIDATTAAKTGDIYLTIFLNAEDNLSGVTTSYEISSIELIK